MLGLGLGISKIINSGLNSILMILSVFKSRVAADSGTFDAESCLNTNLTSFVNSGLYDKASLILTPNAFKASKMYALKPTDGSGDLTFTRSSTAIRRNSAGLLESVASNIPRLHYPVGGGCPSWLLEPQRTNAITQSNTFLPIPDVWYDFNGMVPVANSATDPFGANNGWLFSSASAFSRQYGLSISTTIGDVVTMSVFVKKSTATTVRLRIQQSVNASYIASATYNLDTNTVTSGTGTIENQGNGWYRISVTGTTTVINSGLRPFLDSVNGNLFVFGFQAEIGAYATSYIPTTTSSVTRVTEGVIKTGISSLIGQTEGTLFFNLSANSADASSAWLNISDGSTNNWFFCGVDSTQVRFYVRANNVVVFDNAVTALTVNTFHKIAIAYKNGDVAVYMNGVQRAVAAPSITFTATLSALNIGGSPALNATNRVFSTRQVMLFTSRLTNAELAALTTL